MENQHLINDLQRVFSRPATGGVLDLDDFSINRRSFELIRLEHLYDKTKGVIPPFRQSEFLLLFVKKGAGKRTIGRHTFSISDNSLAIVPPRVIHASTYTDRPEGYLITFNADFFLQQSFSYKLLKGKRVYGAADVPYTRLSAMQAQEVTAIFETIIAECAGNFEEANQMIALKVLELLILCDRLFCEGTPCEYTSSPTNTVQLFNELVEAKFSQSRQVQFYAHALHTHPNNLNYIVKKATGITAKQTISNRVMAEAKSLLGSTSLSIKEIAYELGFEDPNYFISFFTKEQKRTPAAFRSELV
jgi:AraC-like DNA-binding protein